MIESLINKYSAKCDYIDARIVNSKSELISLNNGRSNHLFSDKSSFGVRVLIDGNWGFAYSSNIDEFESVIKQAFSAARLSSGNVKPALPDRVEANHAINFKVNPFSVNPEEKIKLLSVFDKLRSGVVKRVNSSILSINSSRWVISPLVNVKQEFTNNLLRVGLTARDGSVIQSVSHNFSELGGFEVISSLDFNSISSNLIERVNRLLHAKAPKPERASVVLDPMMTGLFFHEAVGHACEADAVINDSSVMKGRLGTVVASDEVTLLDDPTVMERGFYWFDDEGVKASPTTLIERGLLKGFMHSLTTAGELGVKPSGNGRAMNGDSVPIPRMSNTVLKPGSHSFDDLLDLVGDGYLVKGFSGGVVDPVTGQFSFGASECFRVERGVIAEPLRDVTLAGSILESLKTVMVGNDPVRTRLTGTCGKDGQHVRVGDYCPSMLVRGVIVGGRS